MISRDDPRVRFAVSLFAVVLGLGIILIPLLTEFNVNENGRYDFVGLILMLVGLLGAYISVTKRDKPLF